MLNQHLEGESVVNRNSENDRLDCQAAVVLMGTSVAQKHQLRWLQIQNLAFSFTVSKNR